MKTLARCMFLLVCILPLLALGQTPDASKIEARTTFNNGVKAFRESNPREAIDLFTRALQIDPDLKVAEMYLAATYASMSNPGDQSATSKEAARKSIEVYERILQREPTNAEALWGLAGVYSNTNNFWKAHDAYLRLTKLSTQDPRPFYSVASLDWILTRDTASLGLPEETARLIAEGHQNVDIALAINPQYLEAMTYKNLLLRREAESTSDPAKRERLIAEADSWFAKSLALMKQQSERPVGTVGGIGAAAPPPPPPQGPVQRIGAAVAQANLIDPVAPVYPPLARAARVQGVVVMQALIDKQGNIADLQVVSGHELLQGAAMDAVKQWRYRPVLLNGQPVDVVTQITVNFTMQ